MSAPGRLGPSGTGRGLPPIEVGAGPTVPGIVLRLLPGVAVLVTAVLAQPALRLWPLVVVAALFVTWRPGGPAVAAFVALTGAVVLAGPDLLATAPARLAGLVLALHVAVRSALLATPVDLRGAVEARVVLRVGRSVLAAQLLTQGSLLAAVRLHAGLGPTVTGAEWLRLAAVVAGVGATLLLLPRDLARDRRDADEDE
jgi:hypothetical protein